jgi:A/G-specific adenine glycosylase
MDLASSICTARAPKCLLCPLLRECAAAPIDADALDRARKEHAGAGSQSGVRFEHTRRFARGRIVDRLRALPPGQAISLLDLHRDLEPALPGRGVDEVEAIARALVRDGIARGDDGAYALCE